MFSVATCKVPQAGIDVKGEEKHLSSTWLLYLNYLLATECVSDHGKAVCKEINGICVEETDGYYMVSAICLLFGVIFLVAFIIPTARKLQSKSVHGIRNSILITSCRITYFSVARKDAIKTRVEVYYIIYHTRRRMIIYNTWVET